MTMFKSFFKMSKLPFSEWMPVEGIHKDRRMIEGLSRLSYFVENGGIGLVTGEPGLGKSCLIKLFLDSLSRNRYQPLYIYLTHLNSQSLLRLIVDTLGETPRRGKEKLYLQILEKTHKEEKKTVLIIDEAQLMDPDAFTDLRLLVSSALSDGPPLRILLSGQSELRKELRRARHTALVQRICLRYHVPPLSQAETSEYIDFNMRWAGASVKVFDDEVKNSIHEYTQGVPRQINNLATSCLLNACANKCQKVTAALLTQTLEEFRMI